MEQSKMRKKRKEKKGKETRDKRTNTLYKHVYMKETTSATDIRWNKVIGSFCVSWLEMMSAVKWKKKNR